MRKSPLKLLWIIAGLALSTTAHAVGMGGINVVSALGQPLKANIELMAVSKKEKDSLVARLAPPEAYKSAGLEYPYGNKFKFEIENRPSGEPYIKVSSAQSINDPFVSLLVELSWSAGKLSREYTFLLDPVGYEPTKPAQPPVQVVAPAVQAAPAVEIPAASAVPAAAAEGEVVPSSATAPAEQAAPAPAQAAATEAAPATEAAAATVAAAPAETVVKPEEQAVPVEIATEPEEQKVPPVEMAAKSEESPVVPPVADKQKNNELITVQRGDTLHKLAEKYKLADMNLERMLVALYRVNANQFDGKNMNRIRAGKILRLPTEEEYESVVLAEAVKEIHAQAADWNAYRQKLAGAAAVSSQSQAVQQVVSGKVTSSIADRAPTAKESAKEVLKLSRGEAPGDQAAAGSGGKTLSAQEKKNLAQEESIAQGKALQESQARAAMLEKNLEDAKRLAQLKSEAAAVAQSPATVSVPTPAPAPAVVPAPAKPREVAEVKPKPKEIKLEPSLLDQVLSEPLYQAGGAAALIVLGGLGYLAYKRKKKGFDENLEEEAEEVSASHEAVPVAASPAAGNYSSANSVQAAAQSDHVDPISEADLFLNFGRDAQAEEILKDALQNAPNNHQIHLKLLGIYANRKDAKSFASIARQLKDAGDEDAWQQAADMGRKLEPDNSLYGGSGSAGAEATGFKSMEDTGSATIQMTAFNATPEPENVPATPAPVLDFDFGVAGPTAKAPLPEANLLGVETMNLASPKQELDMDFDITSSHPEESEAQPEVKTLADDGGIAFTLDFPLDSTTKPAPAGPAGDIGLADINLNFDEAPAVTSTAAGGKDDHWQEVATKLDLARAYQEMGDNDGAREILDEVINEGDAEQRKAAQDLLKQLG